MLKITYAFERPWSNSILILLLLWNKLLLFSLEGLRLNVTAIRRVKGPTFPECFFHCLQEDCCRSVNIRGENHQLGEACELLPGVHSENPYHLVKDEYFDHYTLSRPKQAVRNYHSFFNNNVTFYVQLKILKLQFDQFLSLVI